MTYSCGENAAERVEVVCCAPQGIVGTAVRCALSGALMVVRAVRTHSAHSSLHALIEEVIVGQLLSVKVHNDA